MASDFNWHIGSEPGWNEPSPEPTPAPAPPRRRRRWLWLALLLAVVTLIPAYLALRDHAARAETAVRADILTAHTTLWQATHRRDNELFHTLRLNTPQRNWSWQMDTLFARDRLFDRQQMGLSLLATPPEVVTVTVAPALNAAQLTARQQYETAVGPPLTLQHYYAYQLQEERWLLAPLDTVFGGDWQEDKEQWLTAVYPTRDAQIGRRLTADLNNLISQLCQAPNLTCPPDLHLELSLRPEYSSLTPDEQYDSAARLSLPAPSLLGLPLDETGYQTLFRYYGRHLADRLRLVLPEAGLLALFDNGRFARAAWQQLLIQHDLYTWPPPATFTKLPASAWPEATLATLCLSQDNSGLDWWHYRPQTEEWYKVLSRQQVMAIRPLADAVFLTQERGDDQAVWTLIWPDGQQRTLPTKAFADPDIRPFANGQQLRLTDPKTVSALLLDIATCRQTVCEWQVSPETAVTSPNGRQQIRQHGSGLVRSNAAGEDVATIATGYSPFWLQDQIYGYLRPLPNHPGEVEIVAANINDDEPYRLLTTQDLRALLPPGTETLTINAVIPPPFDFTRLRVEAYTPGQNRTFLFSVNRITGQVTLLPAEEQIISRGQMPDDHPFLRLENGLLIFTIPGTETQHTILPPTPACAYAAWIG